MKTDCLRDFVYLQRGVWSGLNTIMEFLSWISLAALQLDDAKVCMAVAGM